MLAPTIYRDTEKGFVADGFPFCFRVILGTGTSPEDQIVIAEVDESERLLPRVAPVVVRCDGVRASWIRLEAIKLSARAWDERYVLQFSEILVFSNEENLALNQRVEASSTPDSPSRAWDKRFLVDGYLPYLMDAGEGKQSRAYVMNTTDCEAPTLAVDLDESFPIDRFQIHNLELSDNVPQSHPSDFGIPRWFVVGGGANKSDFSDAVMLADCKQESVYDVGPILMRRFPQVSCRYVRMHVLEPYNDTAPSENFPLVGIAELEIFSRGKNVALGKPVHTNAVVSNPNRSLSAITDGHNFHGSILPMQVWLEQLATRHDLEVARPRIAAMLRSRYQSQSQRFSILVWLTALIAIGAISAIGTERMQRERAMKRTRERLAADLHDELGANLHAIGLLGDLAQQNSSSPEKLAGVLQRMRALSKRSGEAARYCSNLIESEGLFEDLIGDIKRTSSRIMADLEHTLTFDGEEHPQHLSSR